MVFHVRWQPDCSTLLRSTVEFQSTAFEPADLRETSRCLATHNMHGPQCHVTSLSLAFQLTLHNICHPTAREQLGHRAAAVSPIVSADIISKMHTATNMCVVLELTLILPLSRTGTVCFYTSTSNKRAARPKLYTKSLTRDLKLMYSRFTLVRISIKL